MLVCASRLSALVFRNCDFSVVQEGFTVGVTSSSLTRHPPLTIKLKLSFKLLLLPFTFKQWQQATRHLEEVKYLRCPEKFVRHDLGAKPLEIAYLSNQLVLAESFAVTHITGVKVLTKILAKGLV